MNTDPLIVSVIVACLVFAGVVVTYADPSEDGAPSDGPTDTVFRWPAVSNGGGLEMVGYGDGNVTFSAMSLDDTRWTFQYWLGPDGAMDSNSVKSLPLSETGVWKAVFSEAA